METIRYTLPSHNGTDTLSGIAVIPDAPRASLLIVHGMAEYTERYLPMMEEFAHAGILCFGHDHIGHGHTVKDTKDLGYLPLASGEETLVSDTLADAKRIKEAYPALPLFLLGHSMGSFIARLAASLDTEKLFAGMLVSGTGGPVPGIGAGILLEKIISKTRGERTYSDLVQSIMFGGYGKRFEGRTEFDWLSRDTEQIDAYLADPLCGYRFTVSALGVLTCLTRDANRTETFEKTRSSLPILLVSGEEDPVGGYGKGVLSVKAGYEKAGISDLTLQLYPGARHEMMRETNRAEALDAMLVWITERLS